MQSHLWGVSARTLTWLCVATLWVSAASASPEQLEPQHKAPNDVASASPPGASAIRLSWPDIVGLVDQDPRLAAGRFRVDAARGAAIDTAAFPSPTVEATIGEGSARVGDQSRTEWGLSLSLPLTWIAERESKLAAAEAEVEAAVAEREALRRDVELELRALFWNLAYDQTKVSALEALERQTAELVRAARLRVRTGEARPVEAPRAEVELEKVASELDAARTSLASRRAQLALWLGSVEEKTVVADADLSALPTAVDVETALSRARAQHPALTAARARVSSLSAALDTQKTARLPSVSLTGFADDELDRTAYGGGITVTLPVLNWNAGGIAAAAARLAAAQKELDAVRRQIESAVIDAQAACHASVQIATRLSENAVPRSEAVALIMEKAYRLGDAGLLEVIDARRTLLDARRSHLNALVQSQIDCSRLRAFIGEDLS